MSDAKIVVRPQLADPTKPQDGDAWYDAADDVFKLREDDATVVYRRDISSNDSNMAYLSRVIDDMKEPMTMDGLMIGFMIIMFGVHVIIWGLSARLRRQSKESFARSTEINKETQKLMREITEAQRWDY